LLQNGAKAVRFVSVADTGLSLKSRLPESKSASKDAGVPGLKTYCYPVIKIRWETLLVKEKPKNLWRERRTSGGKGKTCSLRKTIRSTITRFKPKAAASGRTRRLKSKESMIK
jgi:hypothetical protein